VVVDVPKESIRTPPPAVAPPPEAASAVGEEEGARKGARVTATSPKTAVAAGAKKARK
jgi:hypothetical protein